MEFSGTQRRMIIAIVVQILNHVNQIGRGYLDCITTSDMRRADTLHAEDSTCHPLEHIQLDKRKKVHNF